MRSRIGKDIYVQMGFLSEIEIFISFLILAALLKALEKLIR